MPPIARYDGLADWYDELVRAGGATSPGLDALCHLLGEGRGRCLDLGCGTGLALPALARLGWTVVGVDVSADQLRVAEGRAGDSAESLVRADVSELPFADATFEVIVSLWTHTDFDDLEAVLAEVARVLRPGGRFVYVGSHPCFLGPAVERRPGEPHLLHAGYRREEWWHEAPGFRLGKEGVRGRAGVNHRTLAGFLGAILGSGLRLTRIEEPDEDDYPFLIALEAAKG